MRPDRFEPLRFGTGVEQRRAAAVLGETLDPAPNAITIERRIEPNSPMPNLCEAIIAFGVIACGTVKWSRVCGGGIEL
jgi:hypothetical protein